jgi:hypothetical protein
MIAQVSDVGYMVYDVYERLFGDIGMEGPREPFFVNEETWGFL